MSDESSGLIIGIEEFKKRNFSQAAKSFKIASNANPNNPELLIYYNNAKAQEKGRPHPITLAVVIPSTQNPHNTIAVLQGVAQAQNEFNNDKNRLAKRLLNIVIAKDNGNQEQAKEVAQELIKDPNVIGVIGHITSTITDVALREYEKANLSVISPTSSSTFLSSKVFFKTVVSDKIISEKLGDYAIKHNLQRFIIFYENNIHGESLRLTFKNFLNVKTRKVVKEIKIDNRKLEQDYSVPIIKDILLEDKADAAVFFTNKDVYDIVYNIILKIKTNVPKSKKIMLLSGDGLYGDKILEYPFFEGLIFAPPWFEKEETGQEKEYTKNANKQWRSNHTSWENATSYDATKAFIKAISMSKNPDRETVLNNLKLVKLAPNETSGDGLDFSESERKQKPVIVKVVGGKLCPQGEKLCFKLVSH